MFPGAIGRGLGIGLPGLGLGLGGLGLGGLLGPFGPMALLGPLGGMGLGFGLGSFGIGGNARMFGPRGRRSLDENLHGSKDEHGDINCELSRTLLTCTGPHEIIQCETEAHVTLPIELGGFKVTDFVLREKVINSVETLKIVPNNVNHRLGHKLEHLALYESAELAKFETGFWVKDSTCFNDVLTLVKEVPDKIKLKLNDVITVETN